MNKPFSDMLEDEMADTKFTYHTLNAISNELYNILRENAFLRVENKLLKDQVDKYEKDIHDRIEQHKSLIGDILTSLVNMDESE